MLANYLPVLLFLIVASGLGVVLLVAGKLLSPHRPNQRKLSPYECGFEAFEDNRMKFDIRYYLVAILFIIFDLEIAFLFPSMGSRLGRNWHLRFSGNDNFSVSAGSRFCI